MAALIIAVGVFGGLRLGSSPVQPTASTANGLYVGVPNGSWETATGQSGGMTATVAYRAMGWGTMLDAKVTGIPVGTTCQLWVIDAKGNRVLASNWETDNAEGTVYYPGSVALSSKDVTAFEITLGHGKAIQVST